MSDSKNVKADNSKTGNTEKKKTEEVKKTEPVKTIEPIKAAPKKTPEPSKSDRLDRMEDQLNLIEDGILVLINSVQWHNLSITPIGTHNPDNLIDGYTSLQDAVKTLANDGEDKIQQ